MLFAPPSWSITCQAARFFFVVRLTVSRRRVQSYVYCVHDSMISRNFTYIEKRGNNQQSQEGLASGTLVVRWAGKIHHFAGPHLFKGSRVRNRANYLLMYTNFQSNTTTSGTEGALPTCSTGQESVCGPDRRAREHYVLVTMQQPGSEPSFALGHPGAAEFMHRAYILTPCRV